MRKRLKRAMRGKGGPVLFQAAVCLPVACFCLSDHLYQLGVIILGWISRTMGAYG